MRLRTALNAPRLLVICCLQAVIAALAAALDFLSAAKAKLWLAVWPGQYTDQFSLDRREVDMGRSGRTIVWARAQVPISALRSAICVGKKVRICRVDETPHYRWISLLANDTDSVSESMQYRDYIRALERDVDLDQHMLYVRQLVKTVSDVLARDPQQLFLVVACPEFSIRHGINFHIIDGNHRASIAAARGVSDIQVLFTEPR
ncbi:MAG: hypothetical protein ACYC64_03045 [Armatimonadota bacterium]